MWQTFTIYPGYTYQTYDALVVGGVVLGVALVVLIFGRMFWAP